MTGFVGNLPVAYDNDGGPPPHNHFMTHLINQPYLKETKSHLQTSPLQSVLHSENLAVNIILTGRHYYSLRLLTSSSIAFQIN